MVTIVLDVETTQKNLISGGKRDDFKEGVEGISIWGRGKGHRREIELANISKGDMLPDKIWFKQQFSIGVNDVTRVLERMPSHEAEQGADEPPSVHAVPKLPLVKLQAVLLASDCNPKWLTKHLPGLASSKGVPVISVRDNKGGSLRLGELVKLKTALAIGVKGDLKTITEKEIIEDDGDYNTERWR
ncbi:hypothetical protein QJS04_geneDACA004089 [Acorus gramineus]|uniref:Ribosomal protein eL8/eL30/eS12/Gadd45 domain-containing protein n=1 Tax=Acorus gramineus TaxID=55184 RepID=A0AAV9BIN8_ACOGR|nr:hypothetical protein QJS04_geneDACA004089 [Acorus gramineus]